MYNQLPFGLLAKNFEKKKKKRFLTDPTVRNLKITTANFLTANSHSSEALARVEHFQTYIKIFLEHKYGNIVSYHM